MKKKHILILAFAAVVLSFVAACVKDLEEEGVYNTTEYIGTVVEKSTMQPIKGVNVQVTDGTHVHASAVTDALGKFLLKDINFDEVNKNYYLWLDGSALDLPSVQESLKGLGRKTYDYKKLVLYDKTNVALLPAVSTGEMSDIMALTAVAHGTVTSDGEHEVTNRGVCYATHQTPTLNDIVIKSGSGLGSFTANLTGLSKATTYYVRTYATNSIGTVFGAQKMFTTKNGKASISTTAATEIKSTSAVVGGNITSDGGSTITSRGICWGTSENPSLTNNHSTDGNGTGSFSHKIEGLSIGTTYYYRAYATNGCGTTYSTQKSFTTTSGLPVLTTSSVSNITAIFAKCGGNITDNGGFSVTSRGICWNTTGNPDINDNIATSGTGNGSFTANMTGLSAGTTYHVRAFATNQTGTAYGDEKTFTTLSGNISLTTAPISNITATSATGGGNITDNGGFPVTSRGICWNTSGNPTINDNHTTNGSGNGTFTSTMTNLAIGTGYHVRAYATNSQGTSYGNEITFSTTSGNVAIALDTVGNLTLTSATCGANITSDGGSSITARGLCWSTSQYPTVNNAHTTNGSGTGRFQGTMTGLTHNTTYYVRAYATNSAGTSYSSQASFSTPSGVLVLFTPQASNIGENSTTLSGGAIATESCQAALTHGGRPSVVGVCYGTTHNPTVSSAHFSYNVTPSDNLSYALATQTVSNLVPGTTYYVRSYATNSIGTFYSNEYNFTTAQYPLSFTIQNPTNITGSAATFQASISSTGGLTVSDRGFCWGTSPNPTINGNHESVGSGYGSFSYRVETLSPSTTYYVRAYAVKAGVTQYSQQKTFTTTVGTDFSFIGVNEGENNVSGTLCFTTSVPITEVGICWSHNSTPTISDNHTILGNGVGVTNYSFNITNLTPGNGPYYLRAYVRRSDGIVYSATRTVTLIYDGLETFTYNGHTYKIGVRCTSQLSWSNANTYCVGYNSGGHTDWRMPTKNELLAMAQNNLLPGNYNQRYWSSTSYGSSGHYYISATGSEGYNSDDNLYWVCPVRIVN